MNVPRGLVVTAAAFNEQFLKSENVVKSVLREMEEVAYTKEFKNESDRKEELKNICQRLVGNSKMDSHSNLTYHNFQIFFISGLLIQ